MEECSWKLFLSTSKDCLACADYEICRNEIAKRQKPINLITEGYVEDDARDYADYLRELERIDRGEFEEAYKLDNPEEFEEDTEEKQPIGYIKLEPIGKFLDSENIPLRFNPPCDLIVSNFMMLSYLNSTYVIRLTSTQGVPFDAKLTTKPHKEGGKVFKYVKRGDFNSIYTIVRSVVFFRKGKHASKHPK